MRYGFSVSYRNPGHWDISDDTGRVFTIRGELGNVKVGDERQDGRKFPREPISFKNVTEAMTWCSYELMSVVEKENG